MDKQYEDAMQRMIQWEKEHPNGYVIEDMKKFVFPELKESENERIRKRIRLCLDECVHSDIIRDYERDECLAYLEKQKDKRELDFAEGKVEGARQTCQEIKDAMSLFEPKDLTPFEFTFRDYIDSAIRYCLAGEGYQQYIKEWAADLLNLEKQKEKKPIFRVGDTMRTWDEAKKGIKDGLPHIISINSTDYLCNNESIRISEQGNYEFPPMNRQNPAEWNEDNKLPIDAAIYWLERRLEAEEACDISTRTCPLTMRETIEKLKSLRTQPKVDWSEEDKGILLSVKCVIDEVWHDKNNSTDCPVNELEEMWNWLNTIWERVEYPQPHWKPSEEQMKALKEIIEYCRPIHNSSISGWDAFNRLCSLYNDLKKLT